MSRRVAVGVLSCLAAWAGVGLAAACDPLPDKNQKDRVEVLEGKLELAKKEIALLKKEVELLRTELAALKNRASGFRAGGKAGDEPLARVTAGGVKYEVTRVERNGTRATLTLTALSEDKDIRLAWAYIETSDDKGNTRRLPWPRSDDIRVSAHPTLRAGVKQKIEVPITGISLKAKRLSVTLPDRENTVTFRNLPLD